MAGMSDGSSEVFTMKGSESGGLTVIGHKDNQEAIEHLIRTQLLKGGIDSMQEKAKQLIGEISTATMDYVAEFQDL